MQKGLDCIGCKRSFEEGSNLPLEDLVIELKNYTFPIQDHKHKWILLKTIVSLLNSKGGIIFIGAEDKTGEVIGLAVSRKQQDQFKLFIQKLVERIQPAVDLSNRQDIMMQFVPVTKNGAPTGKFLGKIIVKQGITSKLYCFTQKVVLQTVSDKKYDEFDVVYSFKRINMGSVKLLQGYEVVLEAAARAGNPPKQVNIFHEGCNPDPLAMPSSENFDKLLNQESSKKQPEHSPSEAKKEEIKKKQVEANDRGNFAIQFFKISDIEAREKLEDKLQQLIAHAGAKNYNISYDEQNDTLLVEFVDEKQWEESMDIIDTSLEELNEALNGHASFVKKEAETDYALYENQKPFLRKCMSGQVCEVKEQQIHDEKKGQIKLVEKNLIKKQEGPKVLPSKLNRSESIEKQIKENQKKENPQYLINLTSEKKQTKSLFTEGKYVTLPSSINIQQSLTLSITHLNPYKKAELIQYVQSLTSQNKKLDEFDKTIEYHFDNQKAFNEVYDKLQKSKDLTKYGFRGQLRFGVNTGQITLENYDKKKYKEFKEYISKIVGSDMKRSEFTKKGSKYSLLLTLKDPRNAAKWLDKLIQDKEIKQFRIAGANNDQKMKIDLVCVKPTKISKNEADE